MNFDAWTRLVFTLFVLYLWADNLIHAYRGWTRNKDPQDVQPFRAFLHAFVFLMGTLAFVGGAIVQFWPEFVIVSRFVGFMVTGALLVVGIFTRRSWRKR